MVIIGGKPALNCLLTHIFPLKHEIKDSVLKRFKCGIPDSPYCLLLSFMMFRFLNCAPMNILCREHLPRDVGKEAASSVFGQTCVCIANVEHVRNFMS
jgi:hypothetical protein